MGLKNGSIAAAMAKVADWALNEQCNRFHECGDYASFIALNKAVFNVEYTRPDGMTLAAFCPADNRQFRRHPETVERHARGAAACGLPFE